MEFYPIDSRHLRSCFLSVTPAWSNRKITVLVDLHTILRRLSLLLGLLLKLLPIVWFTHDWRKLHASFTPLTRCRLLYSFLLLDQVSLLS